MVFSNESVQDLKLGQTIRMMEEATAVRRLDEQVQDLLDGKFKQAAKDKILAAAKESKEPLTQEQIDTTVEKAYTRMHTFEQPQEGFENTLANIYINRGKIAKAIGIPLIGITVAGLFAYGTVSAIEHHRNVKNETAVEQAITSAYNIRDRLNTRISSIGEFQTKDAKAKTDLESLRSQGIESIAQTSEFFDEIGGIEKVEQTVTIENYGTFKIKSEQANSKLVDASTSVESAEKIIGLEKSLETLANGFDISLNEIKVSSSSKIPKIMDKAIFIYDTGMLNIGSKNLDEAKKHYGELNMLKLDAQSLTVLPGQAEKIYHTLISTAKEQKAKDIAEELYTRAQNSTENTDIKGLRTSVEEMNNLNSLLVQEYSLKIVNKPGVKSGIDRYYTDHGRRSSGFYLIIEAVAGNGNVLSQKIRSEENGSTSMVTMWGERVPESVYESVKADKMDDGIIQKDTIGRKKRGYMDPEMTYRGISGRKGQITQW